MLDSRLAAEKNAAHDVSLVGRCPSGYQSVLFKYRRQSDCKSREATAGVSSTIGFGIRNKLSGVPVVALRLCLFWEHRTSDLRPRLSAVIASQLSCSRVQSRSDDTQLPGTRVRAFLCDNLLFEGVFHIEFDFVLSQDFHVLLLE